MSDVAKKLTVYWVGMILLVGISPAAYFYEQEISGSNVLTVIVFFVMIPVAIIYFSIISDIFSYFGYKLFFLLPLVVWPRVLAAFLLLGPIGYLSFWTWEYLKMRRK